MAGIDYTTAGLINELKVRRSVPTTQGLFLDADFVTLMNSQMHSRVIPAIKKAQKDYFVVTKDIAIVANQNNYAIPSRAIAGGLRDLVLVDSNGTEIELPLGRTEDNKSPRPLFQFYFQAHEIILLPTPTSQNGQYVRFKYERRPNNLCIISLAATITTINTLTKVVTVSRRPSTWTVDTLFDITNQNSPFNPVADDQTISAISGFDLTFDTLPDGIAVGQYVAEAGITPIPQMPYEAHLVIAQFGAAQSLSAHTKPGPMKEALDEGQRELDEFLSEISPRVEGEAVRVVNQSGGIFSASGYGAYGYRANVGP